MIRPRILVAKCEELEILNVAIVQVDYYPVRIHSDDGWMNAQ